MFPIFLMTTITCKDVFSIVDRIQAALKLSQQQKMEIIRELKKVVSSCPVVIQGK